MSRTLILFIAMGVVLIGGAAIALIWWSLADRFFPGAARSTGQGLRRSQRQEPPAKAVVVREFDAGAPGADANVGDPGAGAPAGGSPAASPPADGGSTPPPDRGPR